MYSEKMRHQTDQHETEKETMTSNMNADRVQLVSDIIDKCLKIVSLLSSQVW